MTILNFRWIDRESWNTIDIPIPKAGDYLASDGIETWIMRREEAGSINTNSRVKYWKEVKMSEYDRLKAQVAEMKAKEPKIFLIRDNDEKIWYVLANNSELAYKLYAAQILKLDTDGDFDTGNVDIEVVELKGKLEVITDPFE